MSTDKVICRCEEITESEIREAISSGAASPAGVKRRTRAGMGLCQGKTCQRLIARILCEETGMSMADLVPNTSRPPCRPMKLQILAEAE